MHVRVEEKLCEYLIGTSEWMHLPYLVPAAFKVEAKTKRHKKRHFFFVYGTFVFNQIPSPGPQMDVCTQKRTHSSSSCDGNLRQHRRGSLKSARMQQRKCAGMYILQEGLWAEGRNRFTDLERECCHRI